MKSKEIIVKSSILAKFKQARVSYLLMSPFLILFLLFTVVPIISAIFLSLTSFTGFSIPKFIGFSNFQNLFLDDDVFLIALKNTLVFALLTGPISYLLCYVFAWLINELNGFMRSLMTLVFYVPSLCSSVFFIWMAIFSGDSHGFINGFLLNLRFITQPIQWLSDPKYNFTIVIIVVLWMSLGTSFLSFIAGFKTIDPALYEAGAIDGITNRFYEVIYITLPNMKPQLLFGAVMQISASFAIDAVPRTLTGFPSTNYSTHTIMTHIFDYGSVRYELGYASTIAVVLFAMMLIVRSVIFRVLKED